MKKVGKALLWVFFFPIMFLLFIAKNQNLTKCKKVVIIIAFSIFLFLGNFLSTQEEAADTSPAQNTNDEPTIITSYTPTEQPKVANWWTGLKTPELKDDIEIAFKEIGENPENIISVEHVKDRKTDLFIRRDYKVCFDKGEFSTLFSDDRPWVNSIEWRITTEEWYEGEPEREQHPREYLVAIKFWFDDDSTNILQWSHNGNGELQQ